MKFVWKKIPHNLIFYLHIV